MHQRRTFMQLVTALGLGMVLPRVTLATGGKSLDLVEYRGQVVLVDFWASWCGPCQASMPWLNEVNEKYKDKGLKVLGVNLDESVNDADRFLAKYPVSFDIVRDPSGQYAAYYQLETMPSSLLFDRDGNLLSRHNGFLSDETEVYEARISAALAA